MNFEKFLKVLKVFLLYIAPAWLGVICGIIISYQAYLQEDKALACAGGIVTAMLMIGIHVGIKWVIEWIEVRNALIKNVDC